MIGSAQGRLTRMPAHRPLLRSESPGVGTGIGLALSAGEFCSSLKLSTLFVLSAAEPHWVRHDEIERRRALAMGGRARRGRLLDHRQAR
ncbi:hypothetical protein ACIA8G_06230 [Lentzea sp. NPDC051213]|uniref:hypothetical protein n=1 Tax=Lentzea sp. NPDC051213 TaxID=3364126 RepID=UPI00379927A5